MNEDNKKIVADALFEIGTTKLNVVLEEIKDEINNTSDLYYFSPSQQDNGKAELEEAYFLFKSLGLSFPLLSSLFLSFHLFLCGEGKGEEGD